MSKLGFNLFLILFSILLIQPVLSATGSISNNVNTFILSDSQNFDSVVTFINSNGGKSTYKFQKEIIWAYIPENLTIEMNQLSDITLFSNLITNESMENWTSIQKTVALAWNLRIENNNQTNTLKSREVFSWGDSKFGREGVFPKPYSNDTKLKSLSFASAPNDDKYLIGDVSVGLIFVQNRATDGQIDWWWVTNYDWDSDEYSVVINKLISGLEWFSAQKPNAYITWSIEPIEDALVNNEPTDGSSICEGGWVNDALSNMGYGYWIYMINNDTVIFS